MWNVKFGIGLSVGAIGFFYAYVVISFLHL